MKRAVYALSGDPLTYGHINIADRILNIFDQVLIGLGINSNKNYLFSLSEREYLTKRAFLKYGDRVIVKSYSGLLTDFAYENQINTIIRGARNSLDFDFERMLTDINHGLKEDMDTFILIADQKLSHISSSAVKELQKNHAKNIQDYVPLIVKEALEKKISKQLLIGVTGGIGSGKSYITKKLVASGDVSGAKVPISYIDMDEIGRYILRESKEPLHVTIREKIANCFGEDLKDESGNIRVKDLLTLMFDDPDARNIRGKFEEIMAEPTMHIIRRNLAGRVGIVLINSALFVEAGICDFVNNNIILVDCPEDIRVERLAKRGYTPFQIENRIKAQKPFEEKKSEINKLIQESGCGRLRIIENKNSDDTNIFNIFRELTDYYQQAWNSFE